MVGLRNMKELDEVIAEQNRQIIESGGPKMISKTEQDDIGREIMEIRRKNKARLRDMSDGVSDIEKW